MKVEEAQRLALKMATRLGRETGAPVLVAVFDIENKSGSTIVVASQPDNPGDAQIMAQVLHEGLKSDMVTHMCACGNPNCRTLHATKIGAISES